MMTPINQMIRFGRTCSRTYSLIVDEQVKKDEDERTSRSRTATTAAGGSAGGE